MSDLAAFVAVQMLLDRVAPLANAARDAIPQAAPDQRAYAQRLAAFLDAERERLVQAAKRLTPPQQAPSTTQGRPGAPQQGWR